MKKIGVALIIIIGIVLILISGNVCASTGQELSESNTTSELTEMLEKSKKELNDFVEAYGDETYGFVAYVLDKIRFFSIPLCFLGIAISAIYQYVIGIRKLDTRYKGFFALIAFVTILIVCQILPFIFVVVVKFGRS